MSARNSKRSSPSSEVTTETEISTGNGEEKTIPFLRRLRDMLLENEDVISFVPGSSSQSSGGRTVLGRIVVHDRIQVEAEVLPKYFNHSSFASLRRQLNYFSFVRLGKGRQRESTYINKKVVKLDDILHLKRRGNSSSVSHVDTRGLFSEMATTPGTNNTVVDTRAPVLDVSGRGPTKTKLPGYRQKRRRQTLKPEPSTVSPRSLSPFENNFVSEDEHCDGKPCVALDLTRPDSLADAEVLEGCRGLLSLATRAWD